MKSSAEKSSKTASATVVQASRQPFMAKAGRGSFFPPAPHAASPVQMKLAVNQPGDKFEQEADRMADRVMRMPAPAQEEKKPQHQPEEKLQKKEEEKRQKTDSEKLQKAPLPEVQLQRKDGDGAAAASDQVQSALRSQTAGGQPLSSQVRSEMEPRFNADFSQVRVHSDAESASLSQQLGARAFAYQNHVFFSHDQYQPGTSEGRQLLAHELTHTLQQSHGVQRKAEPSASAPAAQKATAAVAGNQAAVSSEAVDISANIFSPPQKVSDEIQAQGSKGLTVRVFVKGLTGEGRVKVRMDANKNYDSIGKGAMPLLNAWADQMGGLHLNFSITNNEIKGGYASLKPGGGDTNDWLQSVQKNAGLLGGLGLKVESLPVPVNKFDSGKLTLGVTNLKVEVGGFVDALFNIAVENSGKPKIDATADVNIKGAIKGQLKLDNTQDKLTGQVSLVVDYKSFSGAANVKYLADGTVDVSGKAAYNADKLSGEIQFVSTDLDSANKFSKDAIAAAGGKENIQNAPPPGPVPAPKAGQKKRALAATGLLGFNLTTWFAGTVNVVVDGKGAITVIGKIAPPGEIELFKQKDWDKELIKFEARAYYGIPVVGNLNLFANISLHALAKLGPAKIYNIEILGTYSTDPEVQKNIQISGSINISAYAGLRLRAEGGAGIEIASHDLKFGVGLNADIGVKAYADARPTVGYRDPGVFYMSGTLEMVAQPMLGLGGDFFIQLETPWWSPLSDDKWTWPLFSKEWPLSDPIGISASVKDYVLGSGKTPEVELKKPEFDPSKFMTNMVDRTLPDISGGPGAGQGTFKEDGSVPKPEVKPKKPAPKIAHAKPGKKGSPPKAGKSATPDPKAAKELQTAKIFQNAAKPLSALKSKGALSRAELNQELAQIKAQVSGIDFGIQLKGEKWVVTQKAEGKTGKGLELEKKAGDGKQTGELPDIDTPVKIGDESHTIRVHFASERVVLLMASGSFDDMRQKIDAFSKAYMSPFREINANEIANEIEKRIEAVKMVVERGESHMSRQLKGVTDIYKRASVFNQEAHKTSLELKKSIEKLSKQLSAGKLGKAILGMAAKLKPGDAVVFISPERAMVVSKIKQLKEYGGKYEFVFTAESADGDFKSDLLYLEEGIKWRLEKKPHYQPFKQIGIAGGTVVIDKAHLNSGSQASYIPPFYGQTIGGKSYSRKGHLVAVVFGGPGGKDNIVALTHPANEKMRSTIEVPLSKEIKTKDSVYIYNARPIYFNSIFAQAVDSVEIEATKIYPNKQPKKVGFQPIKND